MRFATLCLLMIILAAAAFAQNSTQARQTQALKPVPKKCSTNIDCDKDQCCVKATAASKQGNCRKLSQKVCVLGSSTISSNVHVGHCPCVPDKVCTADGSGTAKCMKPKAPKKVEKEVKKP